MFMYRSVFLTPWLCFMLSLGVAQDYNILDFGAKPGGLILCTQAIQTAIDSASLGGGGKVVIPADTFLSGSIVLKSGVTLHLEAKAVLLGSTKPEDYKKLNRWKAFLLADSQQHIRITGSGEINGQGRQVALHLDSLFYIGELDSSLYNLVEMRPKYYLRPQLIEFSNCDHVSVEGVSLKNAACWVQTYNKCQHLTIDQVHTISDAYWNNDGMDIQDCRNVRITNCYINSADDGICLKSRDKNRSCDSIYISNCTVRSSASAVKFGTRSHGGFRHVVIKNMKVYDTFRSAIAIECVDGGKLEDVLIDQLEARNTGNAIFIRLGDRYTTSEGDVPVGSLRNITIKNIKVTVPLERPDYAYEIRGPALPFFHNVFPASITGIPGHPVENVSLENIEIMYPGRGNKGLAYLPITRLDQVPEKAGAYPEFSMFGELPAWGLYVRHVRGLTIKDISLQIQQADYRPATVFDDVQQLSIQSFEVIGDQKAKHIILHDTDKVEVADSHIVLRI